MLSGFFIFKKTNGVKTYLWPKLSNGSMKGFALITGAASGIGFEFAKIALLAGYDLALVDVNEEGLNEKSKELRKSGDKRIECLAINLAKDGAAKDIYTWVNEHSMDVSILFNNAGFGNFGYFKETNWDKDEAMLKVHMVTATHLIKLLLPGMLERGSGKILNNASVAAFVPGPLMSTYHASKAYLLYFTQALANEIKGSGVTATVLCPGMTKTGFAKANGNDDPNIKFNIATAEGVAQYAYDQMMSGKVVAVPGFFNKLSAFLPRFLTRNRVTTMVGNIQRKNHAKRKDGAQLVK